MSRKIEQLVNLILRDEKISSPPINAESLAEFYFGLDFDCDKLSDNTAAALSVAEKKIYMNELFADKFAANVGFKNFTVAHELGHWVLHRNLPQRHSREIEREAEKFAVYLLMPETFVREEFAKLNSSRLSRCFSAEDNLTTMANIFCVSRQAMRIRLSQDELNLIYVKDGKCYRSREEFLEKVGGQMRLF